MCTDCLCVHNSLALHDVDKWDENLHQFMPYTPLAAENVFSPSHGTDANWVIPAFQTTHGRWKMVNLGQQLTLSFLFSRGIYMSNPKNITRCFSFKFLDVCMDLTHVAAVSQTNLQRVYSDSSTPDKDVFNETFLFYRVIRLQLIDKLMQRMKMGERPSGELSVLCLCTRMLSTYVVDRPMLSTNMLVRCCPQVVFLTYIHLRCMT